MTGPQIGDRISEYVLDQQVGAGSFGQVWKAHHHIWKDTIVAIKIPTDSQFVRNLQKEGLTIHGLKHPNIVRAIGLDPYATIPYLVMEFVDGRSLRQLIVENTSGMPVRSAQFITCGILRALEHAHANDVIHRDIKPENILIAGGPTKPAEEITTDDVKVTDFGLGRVGQVTTSSILQSGSLLSEDGRSISGTLAYMAPEQRDSGETDARSDLYSVGIVLFEMLCGERPGGSDLPSQVREGLPSWVDPVYSRLYTRRERRFASATDTLRAIEAASVPPVIGPGLRVPPTARAAVVGDGRKRVCEACGAAVEPGDNFCIICGRQVVPSPRRCVTCGAYPAAEDRFCVFCGAPLPAAMG
jgi:serine/threonine protein kinase